MAIDPAVPGLVLFGSFGELASAPGDFEGIIARSTDCGVSWQAVYSGAGVRVVAIERDPLVPGRFIACCDYQSGPEVAMLQSSDYGSSWEPLACYGLGTAWPEDLAFSLSTPSRVLCAGYGGISLSQDGQNWVEVLDTDAFDVEFDPLRPGHVYAACGSDGVYRSTDDGATWESMGDLLPGTAVSILDVEMVTWGWLYAGSQTKGAFRYDLEPTSVPGDQGTSGPSIRPAASPSQRGVLLEITLTGFEDGVDVFDLSGRVVRHSSVAGAAGQSVVPIDELLPGVYFAGFSGCRPECRFVITD